MGLSITVTDRDGNSFTVPVSSKRRKSVGRKPRLGAVRAPAQFTCVLCGLHIWRVNIADHLKNECKREQARRRLAFEGQP